MKKKAEVGKVKKSDLFSEKSFVDEVQELLGRCLVSVNSLGRMTANT